MREISRLTTQGCASNMVPDTPHVPSRRHRKVSMMRGNARIHTPLSTPQHRSRPTNSTSHTTPLRPTCAHPLTAPRLNAPAVPSPPPTRHAPLPLWRVAEAFMHTLYTLFGEPED